MSTATYVKDVRGYRGAAKLYRLDPPAPLGRWGTGDGDTTEHVIVSAVHVPTFGPETYIFPANADGDVTNWGELEGSYRGSLDHEKALRNAGYEVA